MKISEILNCVNDMFLLIFIFITFACSLKYEEKRNADKEDRDTERRGCLSYSVHWPFGVKMMTYLPKSLTSFQIANPFLLSLLFVMILKFPRHPYIENLILKFISFVCGCVCVVLGLELRAFTLSHSTCPIFVKIGSCKLFPWAHFLTATLLISAS
jgi:hypothetical protein